MARVNYPVDSMKKSALQAWKSTPSTTKQIFYCCALTGIVLLAALLRFWNLGELQQLVFDEVYFPKYAHNYLTGTYFFDSHPPLSKYIIAAGIWLHNNLAWTADPPFHLVEIEKLSAVSWRWMNAFTGTILCLITARLAWLLYPSRLFSLLCALFIAIDGTFIVDSRFGMNNIYLTLFGTCAMLYLVKALRTQTSLHTTLAICGVFLGCTYSVKWNGLGISLAAWMIIFLFLITKLPFFSAKAPKSKAKTTDSTTGIFPLPESLKLWHYPLYLIVLPFIIYSLIWIPHVTMYEQHGFVEMQRQIFGYHANTVKETTHPYCSVWYTWPLLIRPIGYYFNSDKTSANEAEHVFTDVHLLGNPLLFWLSALAMLCLTLLWLRQLLHYLKGQPVHDTFLLQTVLVAGFFANWLPWSMVSRCVFQYHYMPASLFAFMALAWFTNRLITSTYRLQRLAGIVTLVAILCAFLYWLPIQMGFSLHPENFYDRMWLRSWI